MAVAPRLTVGLPVYNGERYLPEALDGLLAQTYGDFDLVISDNASTDATQEICRTYAARDARIVYLRQPRNVGAIPNHNLLLDHARGEFFKWASHDDLFAPTLLERCVQALDDDPRPVLAHVDMAIVGPDGAVLRRYDYRLATASPRPHERFRSLLYTDGGDDWYGVIRTAVMRRIPPVDSYHHAGRRYVAELALNGPFHQVPELLFQRREHPGRGDRSGSIRAVCANLDPRRRGQSTARLVGGYLAGYLPAIHRSPLSAAERQRCYLVYSRWLARRTLLAAAGPVGVGR